MKSQSVDKNCFPETYRVTLFFPGVCNLHKHSIFFCVSNWTLRSIFSASKRRMSASQDAMTHSGYISAWMHACMHTYIHAYFIWYCRLIYRQLKDDVELQPASIKALANKDRLLPAHATFVVDTKKVSDFVQKHFVSAKIVSQFVRQETSWATMCPQ